MGRCRRRRGRRGRVGGGWGYENEDCEEGIVAMEGCFGRLRAGVVVRICEDTTWEMLWLRSTSRAGGIVPGPWLTGRRRCRSSSRPLATPSVLPWFDSHEPPATAVVCLLFPGPRTRLSPGADRRDEVRVRSAPANDAARPNNRGATPRTPNSLLTAPSRSLAQSLYILLVARLGSASATMRRARWLEGGGLYVYGRLGRNT